MDTPDPVRLCAGCAQPLAKKPRESRLDWLMRRYCDRRCVLQARRSARLSGRALPGPLLARPHVPRHPVITSYPGARYGSWADVPPVCPKCCGPWIRHVADVTCATCSNQAYVAEGLRTAIRIHPLLTATPATLPA